MCLVELPSGRLELTETDFQLPGPITICLQRSYRSTTHWASDLGYGWGYSLGQQLSRESNGDLTLRAMDGRRIPFADPAEQATSVNAIEKMAVERVKTEQLPWPDLRAALPAGAYALHSPHCPTLFFDTRETGGRFAWRGASDRDGNLLRILGDSSDQAMEVRAPWGRTLKLVRDERGLLCRVELLAGHDTPEQITLVQYEHDRLGNLVSVKDAAGTRRYEYNEHLLVRHFDRLGKVCASSFDNQERVKQVSGPENIERKTYQYDDGAGSSTCRDSLGHVTKYEHGPDDTIAATVDEAGGVSRFEYDDCRRLARTTDQLGGKTAVVYRDNGIPVGKMAPDGNAVAVETGPLGDTTRRLSAAGVVVAACERDALGHATKVSRAGKGTSLIEYSVDGSISKMTTPQGKQVSLKWSPDRRVLNEFDDEGPLSEQHFNWLGDLILHKDAKGHETHYHYGSAGYLERIVYPDQTAEHLKYDAEGNLLERTDRGGNGTRWQYDAGGRRVCTILANGAAIRSEFDTENRLVAVSDPSGARQQLDYDPRGLLVKQQFLDGRVEQYEYDARGMIAQCKDGSGRTIAAQRDPCGRITTIEYDGQISKQFELNEDGVWLRAVCDDHVLERELSTEGQAEIERQADLELHREYLPSGDLSTVTDHFGRRVTYKYDDAGHVVQTLVNDGRWNNDDWRPTGTAQVHQFEYDRLGNLVEWIAPSGVRELREYDATGQLVRQQVLAADERTILTRGYRYDDTGKVVAVDDSRRGQTRYSYDQLGRLVHVDSDQSPSETYSYNGAGDRVGEGRVGEGRQFGQGHRLIQLGDQRLEYDASGFLARRHSPGGTDSYEYYPQGLLKQVLRRDGGRVQYAYDALGRIVQRSTGDQRVSYFWNHDQIWKLDGADPGAGDFVFLPGSPSPFCQRSRDHWYSVHVDHLGRVLELIDGQGNIAWSDTTNVWGDGRADREPEAVESPIGLPGQIWDSASGFHYNRHRFYWAAAGTFVTPDPIGMWGGLDAYAYPSDPVNLSDPTGLKCRGKTDDPTLYRGDSRAPDEICKKGFKPQNPNAGLTLFQHVEGVPPTGSNWVSTTYDSSIGDSFGGGDGYIYVIDNPGCGKEVDCDPDVMAKYGDDDDSEKEIAFDKAIPPGNVLGYFSKSAGPSSFQVCP